MPCVRCNQTVKFTDLTALARGLGAERLATGHYVRRVDGPAGPELHRAADLARDQSWFLFATTREQLAFALFPLGEMANKQAVRAEAKRLGLPVAAKPDSQDICFVASGHYADTVVAAASGCRRAGRDRQPGRACARRHDGIARYTVGQGKRLGAASRRSRPAAGRGGARCRAAARGRRPARCGYARRSPARGELAGAAAGGPCAARSSCARASRRSRPWCGHCRRAPRCAWHAPALPAPGQACVFYDGARVLGGGFISPTEAAAMVDAAGDAGLSPRPLRIGWRRSSAVEQGNHNPLVGGSNPPAATI